MRLTTRINEAILLSSHLHRGQTRHDANQTPYISHLFSVAVLISSVTDDEDIIIAGLLHDSLEDVPGYTYDRLVQDCGKRVAEIVRSVTEPLDANKLQEEQLPWLTRKEQYLRTLEEGDVASAIVSCADKIHNTESYVRGLSAEATEYEKRFTSSAKNRIWFHEQVLTIVEKKLGATHELIIRFKEAMETLRKHTATSLDS
jgi:(p)ppGpp synthase/HD superfamily hydrolase